MAFDEQSKLFSLIGFDFFETHHLRVAADGEITDFIKNVSDSAAHACGEIAPGGAQHDNPAAGHVFTTMVTNAFNNGVDS